MHTSSTPEALVLLVMALDPNLYAVPIYICGMKT